MGERVVTIDEHRHIIRGDLNWLEYAIADYVAKWGEHWTGQPYIGELGVNIAGIPTGVANMAMTVVRKAIVTSWTEPVLLDTEAPLPVRSGDSTEVPDQGGDGR